MILPGMASVTSAISPAPISPPNPATNIVVDTVPELPPATNAPAAVAAAPPATEEYVMPPGSSRSNCKDATPVVPGTKLTGTTTDEPAVPLAEPTTSWPG